MDNVLILPADAYRMIDALRDYADILESEGQDSDDLAEAAFQTAHRIENGSRNNIDRLIEVERFDLDAAHSAVIGVMVARRDAAQALRDQADAAEEQANRLEALLVRAF